MNTNHKVSDDHGEQEERNALESRAENTSPHRLNPLTTQHSKHDHEGVEEIFKIPPWQSIEFLFAVILTE